ncbi:hypothetical protein Back11_16760 [Paenibacillus baekrokdamisoli]|uniref:Uncharacterized protein n=1 Tax=Paenibacillus baekrokdamisoli TaxID=1712516 RepID=A0A3G9J3E3_9BACL|nr:STM4014 family protein [Paenibacillus baekrokdamisoli]MBB3072029.1 glutathione synthase/RimK-type ligase-like ATP-grasp enzyme [Paenibacillus baekrokdamisoli]BBH20331.1 hypothetical protein Back11_16760 [Paenibacillus baekrokdamisoli]
MEQMLLICNSNNRRTVGLQDARRAVGLPPAIEVNYLDLLQGRTTLTAAVESKGLLAADSLLLRLDAPGEHFEVERDLIALGAPDSAGHLEDDRLLPFGDLADSQPMTRRTALRLREQKGKLYHPSQWFRGYARLLARLENEARTLRPTARWMNAPRDIISMFDKRHTHQVLSAAGLPVSRLAALPQEIPDYEALRAAMANKRMHRIFLKLASGSGACGVIAYQVNPATGAELVVTTMGVENYLSRPPLFYNDKRLHRYTEQSSIKQIINWLLRHGAHAEQWIAKASYKDRVFDIRQLVVGGEACHSIARVSSTPITNLHLQSERIDIGAMGLSAEIQHSVRHCAEQTLAAFPDSTVAGIDVLLSSISYKPYVLDVNPFGDLLYQVSYQGFNTYEWEMKKLSAANSTQAWKERSS